MTITRILQGRTDPVASVAGAASIAAVIALLADRRIGAVPVMEGEAVAGILSERDLIRRMASDGPGLLDRTAAEVMTAPAITVTPDTLVIAALSLMTRQRVRHLPVLEGGHMVGFVSIGDLVKFRIDGIEAEARAMHDYITGG